MRQQFSAKEFRRLTSEAQIRKCRAMAVEAEGLAFSANFERRPIYEELARHWLGLGGAIALAASRVTRH